MKYETVCVENTSRLGPKKRRQVRRQGDTLTSCSGSYKVVGLGTKVSGFSDLKFGFHARPCKCIVVRVFDRLDSHPNADPCFEKQKTIVLNSEQSEYGLVFGVGLSVSFNVLSEWRQELRFWRLDLFASSQALQTQSVGAVSSAKIIKLRTGNEKRLEGLPRCRSC